MPAPITSLAAPGATAFANAGGRGAQDCAPEPGQAVTSHTWSLSTGAFNLDFTWRRVENLTADPGRASQASQAAIAATQTTAIAPRRQSFQEILRRQQLSQLLLATNRPPRDRQPLLLATEPSPPQPGPVCRAYAQAMGPLSGSGRTFSA